ncbi:MAG: CDP-diacylglycerol--glycerol-3-phosphate 3-phosphatidyltransferase [Planctomycetia bacterium]|nr:CDP-diacylglycerol--glycerol-3-phosphate 3-phosphatidyltransferase [Planctomycetia bacterium]MCC7315404.1 CDP-diacylglycerol--glycerol-3-phosphate 3-phosphatidyltransferase [Planctomycetota bacterium]
MNIPNQITTGRLLLSLVFLGLLSQFEWSHRDEHLWLINWAFWIFIVCAVGDIVDGYLARRHNQITSLGRVLDPFADKILVCGGFVMLLGTGFYDAEGRSVTGLEAWMVVVIVGRELLISSLRGFSEASGKPYAANYWGKVKMVIQSVTVPWIIRTLGPAREVPWLMTARDVLIWSTIIVTVLSTLSYLSASRAALLEKSRG